MSIIISAAALLVSLASLGLSAKAYYDAAASSLRSTRIQALSSAHLIEVRLQNIALYLGSRRESLKYIKLDSGPDLNLENLIGKDIDKINEQISGLLADIIDLRKNISSSRISEFETILPALAKYEAQTRLIDDRVVNVLERVRDLK